MHLSAMLEPALNQPTTMSAHQSASSQHHKDYQDVASLIELQNQDPHAAQSLNQLAKISGRSEMQIQRLFSRWAGISAKRFSQYLSARDIRARMDGQRSLFELALDAGLSSVSRLHDHIIQLYAMTPGEVQAQGAGIVISHGFYPSPFGECHIASTGKGICWLAFTEPVSREESIAQLIREWPNAQIQEDQGEHQSLVASLFDANAARQALFLHVKGSNFQLKVWEALLKIPDGTCCRYQDIAQQIERPRAARAVGTAIGQNPISWLIPCHRVIRGTGVVGHYRWGSVRKQSILLWEQGVK